MRDELHTKEARWSSTLSRYRLRIDSLEAQNKELQNDLKMMEEQRLIQWQKQVNLCTHDLYYMSFHHEKPFQVF